MDEDRYDRQRRIWGNNGQIALKKAEILVVGAGGIGSEIIKNLALLGIGSLIIVDMDLIELSNLNRQLLFKEEDVGKYKAEIAAKQARGLNTKIQVRFHNIKLQELPSEIFEQATLFVSALDNIPARVFLNQKAVLLDKPMVDGGSEGFYGHVQVVIPHKTPCLLCHDIWSRQEEKFKCTYAVFPRTPLDCILEGRDRFFLEFKRLPESTKEEDVQAVYKYATDHAEKFQILGVTRELVRDWMKGTVAALVTTNAIIAGIMTNEVLKILLGQILFKGKEEELGVFYQFNGLTESCWSVPLKRNEHCPVCGLRQVKISVPPDLPLIHLIQRIALQLSFDLQAPMLIRDGILIYRDSTILKKRGVAETEIQRLKTYEIKPVKEILNEGDTLFLKDEILNIELWIKTNFLKEDNGGFE
ncbi:MAG: ThiF family adenylyltransferase [Candidatus Helarchaeota archaeon]